MSSSLRSHYCNSVVVSEQSEQIMKRVIILIIGIAAAVASLAQTNVTIAVGAVESDKGQVVFMMFDNEEGFPAAREKALKIGEVPAKKGSVAYTFSDVPRGSYAITVTHDENSNGEVDRNFIGMPKERVGVTNQFRFGRPNFERSTVVITGNEEDLSIDIKFLN